MNVVIFGCPRGGTSIMGELFEHVEDFDYYFEPSIEWLTRGQDRWAAKNPVDFAGGNQDAAIQRRTPGLPCRLEDLESLDVRHFLWIVRHPLDNIASLLPGLTTGWNHSPQPPEWEQIEQPLDRAISLWNWMNGVGFSHVAEFASVVAYEDLIANPEDTVRSVLSIVGAEPSPSMGRYLRRIGDDATGYQAKHQVRWMTTDHAQRVGRWRETLAPEDAKKAWDQVAQVAHEFGYLS